MSILDAQQGIYSLDTAYNQRALQDNKDVINQYNRTISLAHTKEKISEYMGDADAGLGGVKSLTKGFQVVSDARNFDSAVAGFGTGKGVSGFFNPTTQAQMFKGRLMQQKATLQRAIGSENAINPNNPADLGLQRDTGIQTSTGRDMVPAKPLSADPIEATQQAKASGGLLDADAVKTTAEGGEEAEEASGGLAEYAFKKVGGVVSKLPTKQLGAVADVAGKGMGILSAGEGIADLVKGGEDGDEKAKDIGDVVSGGLDVVSMALPVLAPVAGVASLISGIGDIMEAHHKASEDTATAQNTKKQGMQQGMTGVSLTSAGEMASGQISTS